MQSESMISLLTGMGTATMQRSVIRFTERTVI